jgi:hypothetical protein
MELRTMYRASFLSAKGSEVGLFHSTAEMGIKYLTHRRLASLARSIYRVEAERTGLIVLNRAREVFAICKPVTLDFAQKDVFTVIHWVAGTVSVAYHMDDVVTYIKQVHSGEIIWHEGRVYSQAKRLLLTVSHEAVGKYRSLLELMNNIAERKGEIE